MVTDLFGTVLQELSKSMQIAELRPDKNNSCLLRLRGGLEIQIEFDRPGQFILLCSDLGAVPPGKYRENLFREALRANGLPHPIHGVLAYSRKTDHLILFEKTSVKDLNGEKIAASIPLFSQKASIWKDALERGEIPSLDQAVAGLRSTGGMFGLKP